MIKRDLDEESVSKTIIPIHKKQQQKLTLNNAHLIRINNSINTSPFRSQMRYQLQSQLVNSHCEKFNSNQKSFHLFSNEGTPTNGSQHFNFLRTQKKDTANLKKIIKQIKEREENNSSILVNSVEYNQSSIQSVILNYQDQIQQIKSIKNPSDLSMDKSSADVQYQSMDNRTKDQVESSELKGSDLRKIISQVYKDSNLEKIKLKNEIINRSVVQRAKCNHESLQSNYPGHQKPLFDQKRVPKPTLPQIMTKTIQIESKKDFKMYFKTKEKHVHGTKKQRYEAEILNKDLEITLPKKRLQRKYNQRFIEEPTRSINKSPEVSVNTQSFESSLSKSQIKTTFDTITPVNRKRKPFSFQFKSILNTMDSQANHSLYSTTNTNLKLKNSNLFQNKIIQEKTGNDEGKVSKLQCWNSRGESQLLNNHQAYSLSSDSYRSQNSTLLRN